MKTKKGGKKLALWDLKTFYKAAIVISMIWLRHKNRQTHQCVRITILEKDPIPYKN